MYKIGEFSKITFLTVKALRYYNDIGLLIPARIDEETNYRYYNEENFKKAMYIKLLRSYEFGIKELQEIIPSINDSEDITKYLLEKHQQIEKKIASFRKMQNNIQNEIKNLKEVNIMNKEQGVSVVEVEEVLIASIRYKGRYEDMGTYIEKLFKEVGGKGESAPFALYYDEDYTEENADIEVAIPVKKPINNGDVTSRILSKQKCVSLTHIGPYDKLSASYKVVTDYIKQNDLKSKTPTREIYIKGPGMLLAGNTKKYETKILVPIE
ncbi:GyrI-like domain-containing protein [Clostridiaceae bacterium M8S5]|nr:GyrI-like domain-containing protein [Clostridiaceae bacterium M8S5]